MPEDQDPSGEDQRTPAPEPTEGVRIIGAVEASAAMSTTGEVPAVGGDRGGAPATAGAGSGSEPPDAGAEVDDRPTVTLGNPLDRAASRFGSVPLIHPDMDPPTGAVPEIVPDEPVVIPPVSPTESFELPHYSEPPTGQVPKVVIDSPADSSAWSTLSAQPRWRDTEHQFDEQPDFTDLIEPSGPRLGALADDDSDGFFDAETDMASPSSGFAVESSEAPDDAAPGPRRRPPRVRRPVPPGGGPAGPGAPAGRGRAETPGAGRNLPVAVAVGVGLVAIGLLCFKLGAVATTVLVTVVLLIASVEYFTTTLRAGYQPATLLGIVAVVGLVWGTLYRVDTAYPIVLGLATLVGLMWYLFAQPGEGALMNFGVTMVGIMWIGGLGSFATLILGRGRLLGGESNPGIGILISAVLVSVAYDIGAFFIGRYLGRTPLSKASPNKTQEGLLGGFVVGWAVPFGAILAFGLSPIGDSAGRAAAFTLMCALIAPVGDLCESAIKRDLGVKDMGTLLPGHGGVFDRFDALVFVLPMAWFMSHLLAVPGF